MPDIPYRADYVPSDAVHVGHGLVVFPSPDREGTWEVGTATGWGIGAGVYWATRAAAEAFAERIGPLAAWTAHPSELLDEELRRRLVAAAATLPGRVEPGQA